MGPKKWDIGIARGCLDWRGGGLGSRSELVVFVVFLHTQVVQYYWPRGWGLGGRGMSCCVGLKAEERGGNDLCIFHA